ncbi:hypothetical protein CEXT_61431 [Caerostris extrusa]|uniref:Uncharacterized protein n=1 Tax=Caerostris extrusa TaxID=172846 RepID=A0AAV4MHL1_CAEEX|nr:hypothetical protein CEXT_61431 [Caerostris extrusa]
MDFSNLFQSTSKDWNKGGRFSEGNANYVCTYPHPSNGNHGGHWAKILPPPLNSRVFRSPFASTSPIKIAFPLCGWRNEKTPDLLTAWDYPIKGKLVSLPEKSNGGFSQRIQFSLSWKTIAVFLLPFHLLFPNAVHFASFAAGSFT